MLAPTNMNTICILTPGSATLIAEGNPDEMVAYILWDDLPTTETVQATNDPDEDRFLSVADLPKEQRKEILHDDLKAWADRLGHTITDIIDYR